MSKLNPLALLLRSRTTPGRVRPTVWRVIGGAYTMRCPKCTHTWDAGHDLGTWPGACPSCKVPFLWGTT